ncbi:MAG: hypothetical protein AB203_02910 [Parcubacteria bacterium C7867-008]|nr:MAG: hypothetical protein AB203_02910 [Parcubacteria bacterium C7867-008]
MAFDHWRRTVANMAERRGIPNPLQEEHLGILDLNFTREDGWRVTIKGTKMNRGARLLFEEMATSFAGVRATGIICDEVFDRFMRECLGDLWDHEVGMGTHTLLDAAHEARAVEIVWKLR